MRPAFGPRPVAAPGWVHQPKLNGWRALLHVGTGALWSRHGRPLRHAEKWQASAEVLRGLFADAPDTWLDCEAMGVRTKFGAGKLVVLDAIRPGTYSERRLWLFNRDASIAGSLAQASLDAESMIALGQSINQLCGEMVYEGVVSKRLDSPYLMQNEVENKETATWLKWRFPEAQP